MNYDCDGNGAAACHATNPKPVLHPIFDSWVDRLNLCQRNANSICGGYLAVLLLVRPTEVSPVSQDSASASRTLFCIVFKH